MLLHANIKEIAEETAGSEKGKFYKYTIVASLQVNSHKPHDNNLLIISSDFHYLRD